MQLFSEHIFRYSLFFFYIYTLGNRIKQLSLPMAKKTLKRPFPVPEDSLIS